MDELNLWKEHWTQKTEYQLIDPNCQGLPTSEDIVGERENIAGRREDVHKIWKIVNDQNEDTEERRQVEDGPRKHRTCNPS